MDVFWKDIFKFELGDFGRSYINETIQVRNKSAHDGGFSSKQTARAIDSMALLMQAIKEDKVEEELNQVKDTINYYIDKNKKNSLRRTKKYQQLELKSGLKPWREIVEPHAEIAQGNLNRRLCCQFSRCN